MSLWSYAIVRFLVCFTLTWHTTKFVLACVRLYRDQFTFQKELARKLKNYDRRSAYHKYFTLDPAIAAIAEVIMVQLINGMAGQERKMRSHALYHRAILYKTTFYLPTHLTDPNLYKAIDLIKNRFFQTYAADDGHVVDRSKHQMDFHIFTTRAHDVSNTIQTMKDYGHFVDIRKLVPHDEAGCILVVSLSITSSLTKAKYDHYKYLS